MWLNARGIKIKVQDEWDTFPWATRPKEAHCVTQLHVIPVVVGLLLLPLKCCSHYPALHPGSGSLWTSDYHKNTLKKYHCSKCYSLPTYYLLWSEPNRGSLVPLIPAASVFCSLEPCFSKARGLSLSCLSAKLQHSIFLQLQAPVFHKTPLITDV